MSERDIECLQSRIREHKEVLSSEYSKGKSGRNDQLINSTKTKIQTITKWLTRPKNKQN